MSIGQALLRLRTEIHTQLSLEKPLMSKTTSCDALGKLFDFRGFWDFHDIKLKDEGCQATEATEKTRVSAPQRTTKTRVSAPQRPLKRE